jgi:hypothetical protein
MVDNLKYFCDEHLQLMVVYILTLPLCCEIGAHMNNIIINWNTF